MKCVISAQQAAPNKTAKIAIFFRMFWIVARVKGLNPLPLLIKQVAQSHSIGWARCWHVGLLQQQTHNVYTLQEVKPAIAYLQLTLNATFRLTYDCKRVCLDGVCDLTHITEVKLSRNTDPDSLTQYLFSPVSSCVHHMRTCTNAHVQLASIGEAKNKVTSHVTAHTYSTHWKCTQILLKQTHACAHTQQMWNLAQRLCTLKGKIWRMNTNARNLSCTIIWLHRVH